MGPLGFFPTLIDIDKNGAHSGKDNHSAQTCIWFIAALLSEWTDLYFLLDDMDLFACLSHCHGRFSLCVCVIFNLHIRRWDYTMLLWLWLLLLPFFFFSCQMIFLSVVFFVIESVSVYLLHYRLTTTCLAWEMASVLIFCSIDTAANVTHII